MSPRFDLDAELRALEAQLDEIAALVADPGRFHARCDSVSKWSVAQQLEHVLLALRSSLGAAVGIDRAARGESTRYQVVEAGEPAAGLSVLVSGEIPRGRADAFRSVTPAEEPTPDSVEPRLEQARGTLAEVVDLGPVLLKHAARIEHPLLGPFDAVEWVRFSNVHTAHHLGIIGEILAGAAAD